MNLGPKEMEMLKNERERYTDVIQSIVAIKGKLYAEQVEAAFAVVRAFKMTNFLMCGKTPEIIAHITVQEQAKASSSIVAAFCAHIEDDKEHAAALEEFRKNLIMLLDIFEQFQTNMNAILGGDH